MSKNTKNELRLLPIVAAILLAYGNAYAEDSSDVKSLMTPESFINLGGLGSLSTAQDAKRFSQYTGLNQRGSPQLELEVNKRDDATGYWTNLSARGLGTEAGEMHLVQQKQGNWKVAVDYNEIVRLDPYIIHTGMGGVGTPTPTINLIALPSMPAAWATANGMSGTNVKGSDVELKLKRTAVGVSGDKWLTPELQVELSFRNEDKKGARLFGRAGLDSSDMGLRPTIGTAGANGGWAILLTPEPINSTTKMIEGKLNFNRDKLALTGGYYGSFFTNKYGSLTPDVPTTLNRGVLWNGGAAGSSTVQQLASSAVALPPDNQAHQFYLSGNYAFSDTTRSNFKVSYTHATQDENFAAIGLSPSAQAPASLGGVVDTTLAQLGVTMRPMKDLSVNASLRYEDRNDKTPIAVYNTNGVATNYGLNNTTNWPSGSQTRTTAKVDGIYRLPFGYSVMLGGDWERKASPLPPANTALFSKQVFFRPVLNETGIHAEVRKAISETVNGALGFEYKQRRGNDSDWVTTSGTAGNPLVAFDPSATTVTGTTSLTMAGNYVLPDMYMDRNRTKVRGNVDWEATEKLSLQAVVEHAQDDYKRASPVVTFQVLPIDAGAKTISSDSFSLDTTYLISDAWRVNGFWTRSMNRWNVNKINIGDDTYNRADTLGLGLSGKATPSLTIGVDLLSTRDTTTFNNVVAYGTGATLPNAQGNIAGWTGQSLPGNYLPNIDYRTDKLNLRAKYAIDKSTDIQMMASLQQFETNDWQWGYNGTPFVYSDNTTVSQPMKQVMRFVAANYIIRF